MGGFTSPIIWFERKPFRLCAYANEAIHWYASEYRYIG